MYSHTRPWLQLLTRLTLAAAALCATQCVASPVPEPPNLETPRLEKISFTRPPDSGAGVTIDGVRHEVRGSAGSARRGMTLWAVNLDGVLPPSTTTVNADGSFLFEIWATEGDAIRLQLRSGDRRYEPVDGTLAGIESGVLRPLEHLGCLRLAPPWELELPAAAIGSTADAVVEIQNTCDESARVEQVRVREESTEEGSPVTVVTEAPFEIPPGGLQQVDLSFAPTAPGSVENILLLEISQPSPNRRAVTLFR